MSEPTSIVAATLPLDRAIPEIRGQVILEGEVGLGKSLFMRRLAGRRAGWRSICRRGAARVACSRRCRPSSPASPATLIFCDSSSRWARSTYWSTGLTRSPRTRGKITEFVERHFEGNIILASQPMEWHKPATARTMQLLPLDRDQIEAFLVSRAPELPMDAPVRGEAFERAARTFPVRTYDQFSSSHEQDALAASLSNPMDLTTIATILANGAMPDLMALQEQAYDLMGRGLPDHKSWRAVSAGALCRPQLRAAGGRIARRRRCEKSAETAAMERHRLLYGARRRSQRRPSVPPR